MSAGERMPSRTRVFVSVLEESDFVILFVFCKGRLDFGAWFGSWLELFYHRFPGVVSGNNLDLLFCTGQPFLAYLH